MAEAAVAMQRWMVIWTRPNAEFEVEKRLRKIGLAAIVPAIRKQRPAPRSQAPRGSVFRRAKAPPLETYLVPAFPRYILFAGTVGQPVWQRALHEDGVTMVVRQAGDRERPGLLPVAVVDMLRGPKGDGVIDDLSTTVRRIERFAVDADIVVTSGPFVYFPGVVVGHEGRNIRAIISILGRPSVVTLSPENIQLVDA